MPSTGGFFYSVSPHNFSDVDLTFGFCSVYNRSVGQLKLNEPIQVLVDFRPSIRFGSHQGPIKVIPRAFVWNNRRYVINSLHLVHKEKQGDATLYYFSVSTDTNTYTLLFNSVTLEWHLVEIWHE